MYQCANGFSIYNQKVRVLFLDTTNILVISHGTIEILVHISENVFSSLLYEEIFIMIDYLLK